MKTKWYVPIGILVGLLAAFVIVPALQAAYVRARLSGLWHVSGSAAQWRFGLDGTFVAEALLSNSGTFEVLSLDRIRIRNALGPDFICRWDIDGGKLLLTGESSSVNYRLEPVQ